MSAPRLIFGVPGVFAPDPGVIVEAATLDEALNQVTTADVTLVVDPPAYPADLRLSDWCGAQGVLMIQVATDDGPWQRCVAGVITTAQALLDGEQRVERVELRLRGWPAAAGAKSFASQYRFFQARSSSGIAHDLFTAAGGSVADVASGTTPERAYEVQYGESDETVVLRVLGEDDRIVVIEPEDQGTSFPAAPITLRLSIHGGLDSLPSGAGAAAHVAQRTVQPLALPGRDGVYDVMITHRRAPAKVALAAHHPATPNVDLRSASGNGGGGHRWVAVETFAPQADPAALGEAAARQRRASEAMLISFRSALPWIVAGRGIMLHGADGDAGSSRRVALIASTHTYKRGYLGHWSCEVEARCQSVDEPWRPEPPARPRLPGLLPGVVLDATAMPDVAKQHSQPDYVVHTDAMGRIRVRILWHGHARADDTDDSTIWVRLMTPWAGHDAGFLALPRAGQEVVVSFVNGDPARPIVLGTLYGEVPEAGSTPPWPTTSGPQWVGLGTRSGTGYREHIRFSADPSRPKAEWFAQQDMEIQAGRNIMLDAIQFWYSRAYAIDMKATTKFSVTAPVIDLTGRQKKEVFEKTAFDLSYTKQSGTINSYDGAVMKQSTVGLAKNLIGGKIDILGGEMKMVGVTSSFFRTKVDQGWIVFKNKAFERTVGFDVQAYYGNQQQAAATKQGAAAADSKANAFTCFS